MTGQQTPDEVPASEVAPAAPPSSHKTLKYSLLGPSLTKAGQDSVDQNKVSEIIYNASKGSKFFNREEEKDKILTEKINRILAKKARLEKLDLTRDLRIADETIRQLDASRDLTQYVVHVDCDAFYAAVELLDRPEIADLPFAVGGGVVTTCNYVARKFGVRSGMAGFVAKKLCPDLIVLKSNFDKYNAKAAEVRQVLAEYDPRFESASIDEAYLNITAYCEEHNMRPADAVAQMRREVYLAAKITVSAGIAPNAKLAKICSNLNKPNGQYELANDRGAVIAFMRDLPVRKVNGVGRVFERELAAIGIKTCNDIYAQRQFLSPLFGEKAANFLLQVHLGLGRTRIQPAEEYERKSVGTESTFHDITEPAALREKLRWTADELEKDMKRAECKGRTLVLKMKLHTFEVFTRQVATPKAIDRADDLYNTALPILSKFESERPGMRIRLMGLRCTHLVSTKKPDTRVFFGFRPRRTDSAASADTGSTEDSPAPLIEDDSGYGDDEEWQRPFGELVDEYELETGSEPLPHVEAETPYRRHGKEILPNPKKRGVTPEEGEWWDCPICGRPQEANEKALNDHVDLCLSRQAIIETVQQDAVLGTSTTLPNIHRSASPDKRQQKVVVGKKRGRPANAIDPRQKKLNFG